MVYGDRKKIKKIRRVRTPEVYQIEASECGAASLSIILQYYHCYMEMEKIRYQCGISRDGCSAADLVRAAGEFGLSGRGYSKSLEELRQVPVPCILHWNFNHFVVLEGIQGNHAFLNDPAFGHRKVTMEEMDRSFTGIVLIFEKTEAFQQTGRPDSVSSLMKKRLYGQKDAALYLLMTGILLVMPGLVLPVLTEIYIDRIVMNGEYRWLIPVLEILAGTYLFQIVFNWLRSSVLVKLKLKLHMLGGYQMLYRMFRLPIPFFEQRYTGELAMRLENANDVNDFLTDRLIGAVLNVMEAVFYLILLFVYSPVLTLVGVTGVLVNACLTLFMVKPLENRAMKQRQDKNRLMGTLCAGLTAFSSIKANGAETDYARDILGYYAEMTEGEQQMGRMQQVLNVLPGAVSNIFKIAVLILGVSLVMYGNCTAGILTAFCQLLTAFTTPVNALIGFCQEIQMMKANISGVDDVERADPDYRFMIERESDSQTPLTGKIDIKNISFAYHPGMPPAVRNISMTMPPGSRVGITGASGCGKSTVAKLLSGLLYPQEGEILYDGVSTLMLSPKLMESCISMIGQGSFFFSGTIRQNLTLWNEENSEAELIAALKDADAYELVSSFPGGLEFYLAEGGKNLSGGQRQKLQIARALLRDPSVLIMDEATSELDPVSEKKIMKNIRRRNCTCIIIAHRLSAIRDSDLILVMDRGRIVQYGTHDQLLTEDGIYRNLIKE